MIFALSGEGTHREVYALLRHAGWGSNSRRGLSTLVVGFYKRRAGQNAELAVKNVLILGVDE